MQQLVDTMLNVAGFIPESIVDGPGLRFVIFTQGCSHNCKGCHNPNTHKHGIGRNYSIEDIVNMVKEYPLCSGITISGGEPLEQPLAVGALARALKAKGYEIALYTGYTWEWIVGNINELQDIVANVDIIIDSLFIQEQRTLDLSFRGSLNQRIVDVKKSLHSPNYDLILSQDRRWIG